jgi:repressor LexA
MQNKNPLTKTELEAIRIIRNSLAHNSSFPSVRELMSALEYKSPRSAAVVIEQLIEKGIVKRKTDGGLQFRDIGEEGTERAQTVDVPLVGTVACGAPILAEQNIDAIIPVSTKLAKPPHKYFFLRAKGDSMNEAGINNGDLVLIKQQATASNGDLVVALVDDEATIKEYQRHENAVVLKPRSTNPQHRPIILTEDFQVQGIVVTSIPDL